MNRYMIQASYTADAVASMVKHPEDRSEAVRPVVEQLGGKLLELYFTLGDYDTILIVELPNNTAALAAALASIVPGHLATIRTTGPCLAAVAAENDGTENHHCEANGEGEVSRAPAPASGRTYPRSPAGRERCRVRAGGGRDRVRAPVAPVQRGERRTSWPPASRTMCTKAAQTDDGGRWDRQIACRGLALRILA